MAACSRSLCIRHLRRCIAACRPVPRHVATQAASGLPTCWMAFRMRALCDRCRCARRRPRSCRSTSFARSSRSMFGAMTSRRYRLYAMRCNASHGFMLCVACCASHVRRVAILHVRRDDVPRSRSGNRWTTVPARSRRDLGSPSFHICPGTWAHPVLARRTRRPFGPAAAKVGLPLAVLFAADSRCSTAAVP